MPTPRIFVAVSSPWAARRLVEPVASLATALAAEALVVHVSRPSAGQARELEQNDGEAAVKALAGELGERGVPTRTLLLFADDIARAITNTAVEQAATMIVLGLTGRGVFSRLLAGNVPVELIRETRIPVLLIPPDWSESLSGSS